jgi:hybrid cluster-associated redox disulfide protein
MCMDPNSIVDDVMRRWPATIRVFLNYKMQCIGYPIGSFCSIQDACREHQVNDGEFLAEIRERIEKT